MNEEVKNCQNCKEDYTIEPDDFGFYEKINVPPPTFCPDCRRQRRLAYRNDFIFYNRKCDLCHRNIISIYSPDNPQVIYCNKCWWGDGWDPKSYTHEYDPTRSFFEQFKEFRVKVPALALFNDNTIGSDNCEYTQDFAYGKNCYMCIAAWKIEDCMYLSYGADAKNAVDCMGILGASNGIYETLYSGECSGCRYIQNCSSCINCAFGYDLSGCSDCFMCINLRNKKYCIKNVQYTKEEYEKILNTYALNTYSGTERAKKEWLEFSLEHPRRYAFLKNCVTCTGNNLSNSKNSKFNFHARRSENSKYLENGDTQTDSYDLSVGGELSECYEGLTPDHSNKSFFSIYTWKCNDILYSDSCQASKECFGCVALKHGKYSVFNKEYSREEYLALKQKIIEDMKLKGEWGEFFPMKYSPFAYNESMAFFAFPLSKEECLRYGLKYQENIQETRNQTTLKNIPDAIEDSPENIIKEVLECIECYRNYKIVLNELSFYKQWKIPIPRKCFYCRLNKRFELRGPSKLWHRSCMCDKQDHSHEAGKCDVEFQTSYAPERPEIVYCEKCYQAEVY